MTGTRAFIRLAALTLGAYAAFATTFAFADDNAPATAGDERAPSVTQSDVHLFTIQRDGSIEEHDDTILRANTTSGVDDIAQRYVWFNKDIEQVQLLAAETIDPNGVAHPVGPEAIRDVQEPRSAGAPSFEDGVLRTVIFPGVEPGSRVHLAFRKTRTKPLQAGTFAYLVEPTREPVELQRLIFDLPADVPLYADARGYVAVPPVTANGRTRYEFDYRHGPYAPLEAGAVGYANWGDRLMVSTVPDFASFAARYRGPAADATMNDPAIVQPRAEPDRRGRRSAREGPGAVRLDASEHPLRRAVSRRDGRDPAQGDRHPAQPLWRLQGSRRVVQRAAGSGRHPQRGGAAQSRAVLQLAGRARLRHERDQSRDYLDS